MAGLARRAARNPEFASRVLRLIRAQRPSIDEIDKALRPFYVYRDEYEEVVRTPEFMLNDLDTLGRIEGDCDDISTLLAAVALVAGYRVRFVAVRYSPGVQHYEHVFVEIHAVAWRVVDLTVPIGTTIRAIEVMEEYVS